MKRVLIKDNAPAIMMAHRYIGQILEVTQRNSTHWQTTQDGQYFTIDKKYTELVGEDFEPRSGMVCKFVDGTWGLFIALDDRLHIMLCTDGVYNQHTRYHKGLLEDGKSNLQIQSIYRGMNQYGNAALPHNLEEYNDEPIWERPISNSIKVGEFTGKIDVEKAIIEVGCHRIPMDTVREVLDRYEKLKQGK